MYDYYTWLSKRFSSEDEWFQFLEQVERHKDFPGYPTTVDLFEMTIGLLLVDLFAHQQYILKLESERQKEREEFKAGQASKDEPMTVVIALYFGYYSKTIELKMKPEEYSEAAIERYLQKKYPKLKEFDVQDVIKPGTIRMNRHRRTDISVEHYKPDIS
ncbi:hypothetical protein WCX72_08945 [Sulfurimonas sp. HSL1-6]|uniref:hypothetical protein n=1 Tax=Thiomicrolovo immobilis TaxID=3131935 RepID=UPI0031F83A1A